MTFTIRLLTEQDSIAELTELLHNAYAQLGAMGFNYTAVDQPEHVTRRRISGGECYIAVNGGLVLGTILFHRHPRGCAWYEQAHVAAVHQFGVRPNAQRHGVGAALLTFAEDRARAHGAGELALDTSEGATHLIAWYRKMGYRQVETAQWTGKTYRSVILSKPLTR